MSFGFPAYHTESYQCKSPEIDYREQVMGVLASLSWPIVTADSERIVATVGTSFSSWGEKIDIRFVGDQLIIITSKCSLPSQCFDWGKNKKNVGMLTEYLKNLG